jgi:hypothetical protein
MMIRSNLALGSAAQPQAQWWVWWEQDVHRELKGRWCGYPAEPAGGHAARARQPLSGRAAGPRIPINPIWDWEQ